MNSEFWRFLFSEQGLSIAASMATVITLAATIVAYFKSKQRETIRETLNEFPKFRTAAGNLDKKLETEADSKERSGILKDYCQKMELFAVGVNTKAYDIRIINRMSGRHLIMEYRKYTGAFIAGRRQEIAKNSSAKDAQRIYCEYEQMIKTLCRLRHEKWANVQVKWLSEFKSTENPGDGNTTPKQEGADQKQ